jgi:5-methyltetrahydropteroyltriglutamate--homocysteine methyltransferase
MMRRVASMPLTPGIGGQDHREPGAHELQVVGDEYANGHVSTSSGIHVACSPRRETGGVYAGSIAVAVGVRAHASYGERMTVRSEPPFRADHVGSLLRPKALLDARSRFAEGNLDAAALREVEDASILDVVRMQEEVGLRTATDGEFRRTSWHMDFIYQLGGVDKTSEKLMVHFRNDAGELDFETAALSVHERISLPDTIFGDAFSYLRDHASGAQTPKLTIPSPSMVHYRGGRAAIDTDVYPDLEEFWVDLTSAYAEEVRRLGDLGCTYLQLDDTSLAYLNDPKQRAMVAEQGGDAEHQHELYIRNINSALSGRPGGMRVTTHMCRGNFRSSWAAEGGYDFVAEALFSQLEVDGFFLEYDDERSGGFAPLRFVPEGKQVVLGLVTTKKGALEDKDQLKRRIDEAAKYVSLDQLCLSPQCGFSSTVEGNVLTYEEEVAKLRLIVETAEDVWG